MKNTYAENARVFKAFCDENRLMILKMLQSGEKCACILLEKLEISQPTLSHHMKILLKSGVVIPRKEGKWTHYSIDKDAEPITAMRPRVFGCSRITESIDES